LKSASMAAAVAAFDRCNIDRLSEKIPDKTMHPVIVVGGGLGGLTCAAYLAKEGFPVTLFEQHHLPGGYATSFARGVYDFDVSLHATSLKDNASYQMFENLGLLEKVEIIPLKKAHRILKPGMDLTLPDGDPDELIKLVSSHYPKEKKGIEGFVRKVVDVEQEAYALFKKKDFWKILFPLQYGNMWSLRNKTLSQLLDDYVPKQGSREVLSHLWGYYGLPPAQLSSFYYAVATGGYWRNGSHYIKPNAQHLSNALKEIIQENGGKVILSMKVDSIDTRNGKITGVTTADGKRYKAPLVVSNASIPVTVNSLLKTNLRIDSYVKKIAAYRPSISSFQVWLGLKENLRGRVPGCSVSISTGINDQESFRHSLHANSEKVNFGVTIYDNYFKGYSPPGRSTLSLIFTSGYQPWKSLEKDYFANRKKEYNNVKKNITETLIKRTEKHLIPGLSSMIEESESASPLTNISFTGNPDGAIYGFEQSMNNSFINRIKNSTPVQGLYFASAWGSPGGGYTGVMRAGEDAFRLILQEL